jgi:hypothetical protein
MRQYLLANQNVFLIPSFHHYTMLSHSGTTPASESKRASPGVIPLANLGESDETAKQQVNCEQSQIGEH